MAVCFKCGAALAVAAPVSRTVECTSCNQPVRCCRNCTFYLPGAHWDCRETVSEQVTDKERANFCDWFRLNEGTSRSSGSSSGGAEPAARSAFDDLFS